jgi:aminopeptidase N
MDKRVKIILIISILISVYSGWEFGLTRPRIIKANPDSITENQKGFDILHYHLDINIEPASRILNGMVRITGINRKEIHSIDLNFYDNMNVTEIKINGNEVKFTHQQNLLNISDVPEADTVFIDISYKGTPRRGGLSGFVFGERKGMSVIYNLNEPNYASTWFPCNDFPSDKAMLDIIITNDSSMVSVSNGKLIQVKSVEGNRKSYHWKTFYDISTYLVCIYSAPYQMFSDNYISRDGQDTMSIDYYVLPDHLEKAKVDFEDHLKFMNYFASTFGEYPFIKEKYGVAEFLWQLGAMEHQTITGIGTNFISGRKFFNDVYVHELAHHWWGNAVSPATWKDIWLNEGFATYSEALYAEHYSGKKALQSTMMSKFDESPQVRLYAPEGNIFSSTIYDKGAWVLHMLRMEIGDSAFFNILRKYYDKYKYRNASTNDFIKVCEEISGKDLEYFFRQWVTEGTDLINLSYKWKTDNTGGIYSANIYFEQTQVGYEEYKFPIDLEFLLKDGQTVRRTYLIDSRSQEVEAEFNSMPIELTIDPDNWLLALTNRKVWD